MISTRNTRFSTWSVAFTLLLCGFCMETGLIATGHADTDWQQGPSPTWASTAIPPGWTILKELSIGQDNTTATFTARSPEWKAELVYILEHTGHEISMDALQAYQDTWMQNNGYRICETKDPVKRTKSDHISLKQVYVEGTNKGAVMYSASYPGWGRYHVCLLMTGTDAVAQYFDSIPAQIPDHVKPVMDEQGKELPGKKEIGIITFSPATGNV